mgnify:CR=1 FL=1
MNDTYDMAQFLFVFGLLVAFPLAVWGIYRLLDKNRGEMTAYATVVSHRLDLGIGGGMYGGDNWNRLITFRLKDGSEMELYTVREDYETITDGQSGQITWEKENLLHFDPDIPQ